MRRLFLGLLSLVMLGSLASTTSGAPARARAKTIQDLSSTIPLEVLKRSVGPKLYQSLLVSRLDDWSTVRARVVGTRLANARVIRAPENPGYSSLVLKFASETRLMANGPGGNLRKTHAALMHLLIYKIADGVMAVSFAYPEAAPGQPMKKLGNVRLSVKTRESPWTEIRPLETRQDKGWSLREPRGHRLRRMDRMPMDVISVPRP